MNRRELESKAAARKVYRNYLKELAKQEGKSEKMAKSAAINETVRITRYSQPTVRKYIRIMEGL